MARIQQLRTHTTPLFCLFLSFDIFAATMQSSNADHSSAPAWDIQASKGKWSKVTEKTEDGKGTFCVAKEKISQGEQLLTEEPFMRQIDEKYKKTRCHYCFAEPKSSASRSCRDKDCQWMLKYCSEDCERRAWTQGHQWLCRFPELAKQDAEIIFAVEGYFASRSQNQGKTMLFNQRLSKLTYWTRRLA